jgi:hypothetical protein
MNPDSESEAVSASQAAAIHIALDNLLYKIDRKKGFCHCRRLNGCVFPRNLVSFAGDLIEVASLVGDEGISNLGGICLPSSLGGIVSDSFYQCRSLSTVTFESGSKLCSIEASAFADCSSLSSICIPSSVERLGTACFCGCESLSTITFESDSKLSSINNNAFYFCSSLSAIWIPSSVEMLGEQCFYGCESLSTITFESDFKLSSIGQYAFAECSSLSSICIPPGLEEISGLAFFLVNLRDLSVADGNRHFKVCGDFLLDFDCLVLKVYFGTGGTVTIPNTIARIDAGCFCGSATLSELIFESGSKLSSIAEYAFSNCSSLSSICIPSSVEMFGEECFYRCDSLSTITFESDSKLSSIAKCAFADCSSLSSICIPSSVEMLGERCFYGCKSLSTITFESDSRLSSIKASAFSACSSLSSIWCPSSLETRLSEYRSLLKQPTVAPIAEGGALVSPVDEVEVEVEGDTVSRGNNE